MGDEEWGGAESECVYVVYIHARASRVTRMPKCNKNAAYAYVCRRVCVREVKMVHTTKGQRG